MGIGPQTMHFFFFFSRYQLFPKLGRNLYYKTKSLKAPLQPPNIGLHWLFKKQRHFLKLTLSSNQILWIVPTGKTIARETVKGELMSHPPTHLLAGSFPWESRRHGIQFEDHCSNCNVALVAKFKLEANYITIVSKNNALLFHGIMELWNFWIGKH